MRRFGAIAVLALWVAGLSIEAAGIERFPPPDFETGYEFPDTTTPPPHSVGREYLDAAVLAVALAVATWLTFTRRSRRGIFALMVFSALYFGFWRKGCICAIGAIQNVTLTIFDSTYAIPITAAVFFLLPLAFALFVGRTFCAGVCPLGALQDMVLLRPVRVPRWLEGGLRLFAWGYLAAAVVFAAMGGAFVICRYDPFIGFYRLGGNLHIIVIGLCFLLVGVFVGRPYCRFVCPLSILLRQFSRVSKRRVTITPDRCITCRLCEDACPFGAILAPTAARDEGDYVKNKKLLGAFLVLLPVLAGLLGWAGCGVSGRAARVHDTVRLADRIYMENAGLVTDTTDASDAFRATGKTTEQLFAEAGEIRGQFALGGWLAGGFLGLVAGLKLVRTTLREKRTEYEVDKASCVACGRCYEYCPRQHAVDKLKREGR